MNAVEVLAGGSSKRNIGSVVDHVGDDPKRFAALVKDYRRLSAAEKQMAMRIAWVMTQCVERHPQLAAPHIRTFAREIKRKDIHGGAKRNIVRLLQFIDVPPQLQADVYTSCLDLIADISEPVAVRAFAITVARRVAGHHIELQNELRAVVEMFADDPSPAFQSRARLILKEKRPSKGTPKAFPESVQ